MHELKIREMTKEQIAEESLVDLAFAILEEKKTATPFFDLLDEIKELKGLSEEEVKQVLVQFFTDLNVDGRFLLNHDNTWGLREWYKIETIEEETAPTIKTRKRRARMAVFDDDEEIIDEDDLVFEEEFEEFLDEDEEDIDFDDELVDDFDDALDDLDVDLPDDIDEVDDDLIDGDEELLIDDEELDVEIDEEEE
ncbi:MULTISPECIES: DNA-directed RNA polymerase subunit delta [Ureibacillus]|uniref:DNA-directed RNA polymerase subunit delta n=1 Tax=Ureibacillus TaxID=160795 RepID=UPI000474FD6A|nr:DNA-directed RNA polymerase subunit delta [Ureibacillus thermosphaericus]NKZ32661.1 DNA-directed RNA polymerase subunit delta [Ureibacillus thermosphaericus]